MKQIVILGSTGSIGRQALDIVRRHPGAFKVVGLAAGRNVELLRQQLTEFTPDVFAVADAGSLRQLQDGPVPAGTHAAGFGPDAVCAVARTPATVVLNGLTGYAGLRPSLAALDAGSHLALANKESMVVAGPLLRAAAERKGVEIRPVDSEHSALWQCLRAGARHEVRRLVLTASGGPFRTWTQDRLQAATVQDALRHPTWNMGPRITIDSATLLNKGLEVIEAHGLFGMPYDAVDVVVHPQSIVHSMVEFVDGSVVAQLGTPDMRLPIWIALQAPERAAADFGRLDLAQVGTLTFEDVDAERFPCLGLARQAGLAGGTFPAILNAANEVAVAAFLEGRIAFPEIAATIARVLDVAAAWAPRGTADLEQIAAADARARVAAAETPAARRCRVHTPEHRPRTLPVSFRRKDDGMWTTLLAAVIVLGPVIVFHELGHFLVAKFAGIYVKTFSIGFGPKLLRLRAGETEYALSAIPLGGYVRMAGESAEGPAAPAVPGEEGDAGDGTAPSPGGEAALYPQDGARDEDIPPHRWFRNKPIPTRLAVVTAGPVANLILALVVMTGVLWHEGTHVWPTTRIGAIAPDSEEAKAGLQDGDRLLQVGSKPVTNVLDVIEALQAAPAGPLPLRLERAGRDTTITLAGVRRNKDVLEFPAWDYQRDPVIGQVKKDGPADRAGLKTGDRIVEIDGQPVAHYEDIADHVNPNIGKELSIAWERAGQRMTASVTPEAEVVQDGQSLTKTKKIGRIQVEPFAVVLPVSFAAAARESGYRTWRFTADTVKFLGLVVSGRGSRDAVGGPIRIGQVAGAALRWGFSSLLMFMAFFSVNLFLLNMLPIPVLDGGHVVFLLIEAVRGEAISQRAQELLLKIGVSALIALMSYVVLMDFWRVLQH